MLHEDFMQMSDGAFWQWDFEGTFKRNNLKKCPSRDIVWRAMEEYGMNKEETVKEGLFAAASRRYCTASALSLTTTVKS